MKTPISKAPAVRKGNWISVTAVFLRLAVEALALSMVCSLFWGNVSAQSSPTSATTQAPPAGSIIPSDRMTIWDPGLNAVGGIPNRTTICATVNASTYGNDAQDATAGIQAAINACPVGQVVQLSAGDFKVTSYLSINKGITLRGQGPALTKLKMPVGTNSNLITIAPQQWPGLLQSTNLALNGVKGSYNVTLVSNPGLTVGEIVAIDQITDTNLSNWGSSCLNSTDDCRGWFTRMNRPIGQILEIASIDGNTITFTTPLHINFTTTSAAQLSRLGEEWSNTVQPAVKYAGVEDLYLSGGSQGQGNIWLHASAYSWIKNIESDYHEGHSVDLQLAFRSVVRDSYIHTTQNPNPGGGGYGLAVSVYSSDNLIENNIIWNMNKVMVMQAAGGGNVIAYNYMEDGWISYVTAWMESGLEAAHMTTSHYELFEGNQAFNLDGESTWGSAIYITAFRNHLTAHRRSVPPLQFPYDAYRRAISLGYGHYWYTIIGNVLGTAGQTIDTDPSSGQTGFTYEDFYPWGDERVAMWKIGIGDEWGPADPKVNSTLIRGGNYDYVTNSVHWENILQQALPNSFYLTAKPAFFGSNQWPWVDPTGTTKVYTLPARARFDAILSGGDGQAPIVSITHPSAGATVSGTTVTVSADASDNVGVVGVQFKLDGANLGAENTTPPYTIFWTTTLSSNGSHTITAVARDAAGNSAPSGNVTVTVSNLPPDTLPPAAPRRLRIK